MARTMLGLVGFLLMASSPSYGQVGGTYSGSPMAPGIGLSPMANPYLNPYANPYINPYANPYIMPIPPGAGMGGLYAASVASNLTGIGSGQLSGARGRVSPAVRPAKRDVPSGYSAPGASASHYFQGVYGPTQGADRYYGRHNRHFSSNRQTP